MGLVLTRRPNEKIIIYDKKGKIKIIMKVCAVDHYSARLHFDAPDNIIIDREEIFLRKHEDIIDEQQHNK